MVEKVEKMVLVEEVNEGMMVDGNLRIKTKKRGEGEKEEGESQIKKKEEKKGQEKQKNRIIKKEEEEKENGIAERAGKSKPKRK